METIGSNKILVTFYQTTSRNNIHDHNLKFHRLHDDSFKRGGRGKTMC
jgi:hypothetical protein